MLTFCGSLAHCRLIDLLTLLIVFWLNRPVIFTLILSLLSLSLRQSTITLSLCGRLASPFLVLALLTLGVSRWLNVQNVSLVVRRGHHSIEMFKHDKMVALWLVGHLCNYQIDEFKQREDLPEAHHDAESFQLELQQFCINTLV